MVEVKELRKELVRKEKGRGLKKIESAFYAGKANDELTKKTEVM